MTVETHHWTKACSCRAPQATNRHVVSYCTDPVTHAFMQTVSFYPMPSCEECDTPWVWTEDKP